MRSIVWPCELAVCAGVLLFDLREDRPPRLLHALGQLGVTIRIGHQMMDHLLTMQELGQDQCQSTWQRVSGTAWEETLLHQASPSVQDTTNGLAIAILDGHRDQIGGPIGLLLPHFDQGLHANLDDAALERLDQIVQVVDLPFRENDEHLPSPFHHVDGVAFRHLVVPAAFNGERAKALEPPARDSEDLRRTPHDSS